MYIPSELGYGDRGSPPKIGGGDALVFQMEILGIMGDSVSALTCSVENPSADDCNDRERLYIAKASAWKTDSGNGNGRVVKELNRLRSILAGPMKDELRDWARRRVNILEQLVDAKEAAAAAEQEL